MNNLFHDVFKRNGYLASADERFNRVCSHLTATGIVTEHSRSFSALSSNLERVDYALQVDKEVDEPLKLVNNGKNNEESEKLRQQGNSFFQKRDYDKAILHYNGSIAFAESGSKELSLAYANRSAVWIEIGRFSECLTDIAVAKENNYPENLIPKLDKRQFIAEEGIKNQQKTYLHEQLPELKDKVNDLIPCASSAVKVEENPQFGRFVITTKDINIGEVLAIEKPFAASLLAGARLTHCSNCTVLLFNIIPCEKCCTALFCSKKCKDDAMQVHQYECSIMGTLISLKLTSINYIALKVAFMAKEYYNSLDELAKAKDVVYKSDRYQEVHQLVANTALRTVGNLFKKAYEAAIMYRVVKEQGWFFSSKDEESIFKGLLLHHLQTGSSNFHEITNLELSGSGTYYTEEIGGGCYSFLSLINHSCSPNVVRHCYGSTVVLRALRPIKKGQQLFDNYGHHFAVHCINDRQRELLSQYCFECECEACDEDWPSYQNLPACKKIWDDDDEYITNISQKLQHCDMELAKHEIENLENIAQKFDHLYPSKELCCIQENIKQCYAILASKKIYGNLI